jgi:predicted metal-dependent hydrolase
MAAGSGKTGGAAGNDGVIVEFHRVGNVVKVSAVDTRSFLEVSILAPLSASEKEMTDTVLRKLAWVQAKKAGQGNTPRGKR